MRAPDYPHPLIGWRVWLVVETREGLRLASVMRDEVWPVGREAVARCRRGEDPFESCVVNCSESCQLSAADISPVASCGIPARLL